MFIRNRPNWIPLPLWVAFMRQRDRRKQLRRQLIRFVRHPRLAIAYASYRQAVREADWPLVKERVLALAQLGEQLGDRRVVQEMTAALERVGCYREGARLWFSEVAGNAKQLPNEWRGEELAGKTLLINLNEDSDQGLGIGYRCAHIVANLV